MERRPLEFVSDEDFRKLLRNMNTASFSEYRDYIIIQLLLDTGMRINECLMIQVTDVNLPKRYIYLPAENTKGKKGRHVFFSDKMATQLQRWIKYKDRYATPEIIDFCMDFAKKYGYTFEHEATYEKMCLVNNAVYIAKYLDADLRREKV